MRPNLDSPVLHQEAVAVTKAAVHQEVVVASEVTLEVAWPLEVELEVEDVKFTSPTFVPIYLSPPYTCSVENIDLVT